MRNKIKIMEHKFTPGKWNYSHRPIVGDRDGMYSTQVYSENGQTIATLEWCPMPQKKQVVNGKINFVTESYRKGNAKLIASAPSLLKACQNALRDVKKMNALLIAEGKHGYILMENELKEVIFEAVGSL